MDTPIKTFIIEEHHEAFIVWNYAIQQGLIPPTGNTLFHVDEHSDMGTPRFNSSIHSLNGDLKEIKDFTYRELKIGGFIIPAIYKKLINKVYWVKQKHRFSKAKSVKMYVRSYNQSGTRLLSGKLAELEDIKSDDDREEFGYFLRTIDQIPSKQNVILDIDLDYFSCSGNPNELEEIYIEISENEFRKFNADNYHRLNYCNLGRVETLEDNNNYYYVFNNYKEIYPSNAKVKNNLIEDRINLFIDTLKAKKIRPEIIDICRSRYSGYTPLDQWEFIEKKLLNGLISIYDIEITNVNQY
jgi:hypothetical protein